jgi:hypothetical protein
VVRTGQGTPTLYNIYFRKLAPPNTLRSDIPLIRRSCRTLPQYTTIHKKKQRPAFWRFRNTLLDDKSLTDFMTTIIKYYTILTFERRSILELWDEMKQEIPLQAERYEDHHDNRRTNNIWN